MRARLAGGAVTVTGRLDVLLGGPPTGRPGVVVEVKGGRWYDGMRADGHLYALLVALRDGVVPAAVVTVVADGTTHVEADPPCARAPRRRAPGAGAAGRRPPGGRRAPRGPPRLALRPLPRPPRLHRRRVLARRPAPRRPCVRACVDPRPPRPHPRPRPRPRPPPVTHLHAAAPAGYLGPRRPDTPAPSSVAARPAQGCGPTFRLVPNPHPHPARQPLPCRPLLRAGLHPVAQRVPPCSESCPRARQAFSLRPRRPTPRLRWQACGVPLCSESRRPEQAGPSGLPSDACGVPRRSELRSPAEAGLPDCASDSERGGTDAHRTPTPGRRRAGRRRSEWRLSEQGGRAPCLGAGDARRSTRRQAGRPSGDFRNKAESRAVPGCGRREAMDPASGGASEWRLSEQGGTPRRAWVRATRGDGPGVSRAAAAGGQRE